ncbi:MAG: hypothetical protein FJ225_07515 [Lentisphaerae bacterium]|nr:hypothetical protein [Lentisphaerota bacterium]
MADEANKTQDSKSGEDATQKNRWDELMAKLDAITETLRKACEGQEAQPAAAGEGEQRRG